MRRALLAALVLLAPAAPAAACPRIPAPPPATRAASPQRIDAYLQAVAKASPAVRTGVAGHSALGRPLRYAVITRSRSGLARLRAVRAGTATSARGAPAVVWLAGSVHGNEPSGGDADLRVLHDLAAACHAPGLKHLVVVLLPDQNPDGRAAGTRVSGGGFDLNRDWLAATQPETRARYALLARYPPLVYADQHEQGGTTFFAPPYADPINPALARAPRDAIASVLGPAIHRALGRAHVRHASRSFDLLYPGYGDSATSLLYGAAGMTLEAGTDEPFARRVRAHVLAAQGLLAAVERHRAALLARWPSAFRPAVGAGGWALGPGATDAVAALRAQGVRVLRLTAPARVERLRPWGGATIAPADLPAGTWLVPRRQPLRRWLATALADDPTEEPPSDDVRIWSIGLLDGDGGGTIVSALPSAPPAPAPAAAGPLAGRHLALLADPGAASTVRAGRDQPSAGTAWARWALAHDLGATVDVVGDAQIAAGALAGHDALVVADGSSPRLGPPALDAIRAYVTAGGTLAAWRARGLAVARAAGLSSAQLGAAGRGQTDGTALAVRAPDGLAAAIGAPDPVLVGGTAVAGYADGTTAATSDPAGAGRVLLLGFDPVFRAATGDAARLFSSLLTATPGAR